MLSGIPAWAQLYYNNLQPSTTIYNFMETVLDVLILWVAQYFFCSSCSMLQLCALDRRDAAAKRQQQKNNGFGKKKQATSPDVQKTAAATRPPGQVLKTIVDYLQSCWDNGDAVPKTCEELSTVIGDSKIPTEVVQMLQDNPKVATTTMASYVYKPSRVGIQDFPSLLKYLAQKNDIKGTISGTLVQEVWDVYAGVKKDIAEAIANGTLLALPSTHHPGPLSMGLSGKTVLFLPDPFGVSAIQHPVSVGVLDLFHSTLPPHDVTDLAEAVEAQRMRSMIKKQIACRDKRDKEWHVTKLKDKSKKKKGGAKKLPKKLTNEHFRDMLEKQVVDALR